MGLKRSSTFWRRAGLIQVTFKRINMEHCTVLTHGCGHFYSYCKNIPRQDEKVLLLLPVGGDGTLGVSVAPNPNPSLSAPLHPFFLDTSYLPCLPLLFTPLPPSFSSFSLSLTSLCLFSPSLFQAASDIIRIAPEYRGFECF